MLESLIFSLALLQVSDAREYHVEIQGSFTVKVTEKTVDPVDPPPPPPPPLPQIVDVGPGHVYEELHDLHPLAILPNTTIRLHYRKEPYRSKFAVTQSGITLEGVLGPNNERPVISGENARTHGKSPLSLGIQTISVICVSKLQETDKVTIKNLVIRDAWEADQFTNSAGQVVNYSAGAGLIRVTAGNLLVENCILTEGIHGLFGKCTEGHGVTATLKDCEVVGCGNVTGHNDETVYTELKKFTLDHTKVHDHRKPTATGLHSRDGSLSILNGSYVESQGITVLSNSCEVLPLQQNGRIIGGELEIRDSVIYSTGPSRAVELKTETSYEMTKGKLIISDSLFVKEMFQHEWKSFWITLRDSSQSAEIHNSTFVSCSNAPGVSPTPCYFSTGVNESLKFTGNNTYIGQSPLANKVYMLWGGTARITPENWESTFTVTTVDQPAAMKLVEELIEAKTKD